MSLGAKRKHSKDSTNPRKKAKSSLESLSKRQRGLAVRGDNLKWREVAASNLLNDAEGFFGLEEIDDVEVVKDEHGKGVWFRPTSTGEEDEKQSTGNIENSEWTGFDDDVSTADEDATTDIRRDETLESVDTEAADVSQESSKSRTVKDADNEDLADGLDFKLLNAGKEDHEVDVSAWRDLDLSSEMLQAISILGFTTPTQIQQTSIPPIIAGKDVIGKAVTGSGKTLAFGIPLVERWLDSRRSDGKKTSDSMTALILAPTRELAHQISGHINTLCESLDNRPRLATVTGGLSVLKQQRQLATADVVVATPGRLWEVIRESTDLLARLKTIHFLIVDEADRLLSEGHFEEVEEILDALDREVITEDEIEDRLQSTRQTLVFSATFHKGLQQKLASKSKKRISKDNNLLSEKQSLEHLMLKLPFQAGQKPVFVDANPESQLAKNLSETILECAAMQKDLYLYTFLLHDQHRRKVIQKVGWKKGVNTSNSRILVFTNSVSAVKRLVPLLQSLNLQQTTISPLHSNMPQKSRLRSLERFSNSSTPGSTAHTTAILVATDVAARGLDIKDVTTVFHYHVPRTADTYVHRSGRTARVDNTGDSILLCSPDEVANVTKLIAKVHGRSNPQSTAKVDSTIERMFLPGNLIRQVETQVELAQRIVNSSQDTEKVRSEDNWLRSAAEDLGVDYDSEEFEAASKQGRRGRGGGRERKRNQVSREGDQQNRLAEWKARLREELHKRIDFGEGSGMNTKYLAGGAYDVDQLLAERTSNSA